ncbi:Ger(x)C family spore germination protein [Herbivorax sp. ANBcel31]|uniref:Ger(x)C family spore germination protein n=1 Tax=Herbivorax sp. ANBcel31 TaxID=3069754 RepID=UPI0027B7D7E0|nr:Ger(x)C family spore germination protein [Herbivorax sp. ANBcel31]MDQ2085455.1 Ger(x)C family spore germination protein [Herbivorax sp. ANBcel31]
MKTKIFTLKALFCIIALFTILFTILFTTGCWDYTEIESRGYVLGIAIDKADPAPGKDDYLSKRDIDLIKLMEGRQKYAYTIQIPIIPRGLIKPYGAGAGGGEATQKRTWDLTVFGHSFFEANRQFSTKLDYPPFYEHLKVIIISEEVAREGITESLDVMLRDHEMRRRTRLFVTPESAKKALEVVPNIEDYSSLYLEKLPLNVFKVNRMPHLTDLGELSQNIHSNVDFGLPWIIATDTEIKIVGTAIFKQEKMVGLLGELDTFYGKWVRDAIEGGVLLIESPMAQNELVALQINTGKTKVRPEIKNDKITMNIKGKTTMTVVEVTNIIQNYAFENESLEVFEKKAKEKLENGIIETVEYVQEEYGADVFHFNVALQRYAPSAWDKIEDQWYDIFPEVKLSVDFDVKILDTGLVK